MLHKVLEHIVNLTMRSLEERLSLLDGSNYPQLWRTKAPSSGKATISDTTAWRCGGLQFSSKDWTWKIESHRYVMHACPSKTRFGIDHGAGTRVFLGPRREIHRILRIFRP